MNFIIFMNLNKNIYFDINQVRIKIGIKVGETENFGNNEYPTNI